MMLIRPIRSDDLDDFERLAIGGGVGMTSLPHDRQKLAARIAVSELSFAERPQSPQRDASYLFALQDTASGRMLGTSGIIAQAGHPEPVYSYRLGKVIHASRELGIYNPIEFFVLSNEYSGNSEICSLLLDREQRRGGNGKLLSKCRFLFMAAHPQAVTETIFAEMRGVSDARGHSPFWDALGSHFFSLEFAQADFLSGTVNKTFIAELMPHHPLYVPLLTEAAQQVIGQPHEHTLPALRMLEREGFEWAGYVDIFDAGPTVEARREQIRAVADSRHLQLAIGTPPADAATLLIGNDGWADFRCLLAAAAIDGERLILDATSAALLERDDGQWLRAVEL